MTALTQALKSKTIWFAIILAVLSVVQGYIGLLPLTPIGQMCVGMAIAAAITLLRVVTTQPIVDK
jgi:quinol-cytochrome oxidoreductase complex cytochrome b subunit